MRPNNPSAEDLLPWIEQLLQNADTGTAFDALVQRFKSEKQYQQVFETRLLQKRLELGLPLVSQPSLNDLPPDIQSRYQDGYVQAAREVGGLYLADGNIPRAWPYFRALGDFKPIVDALDTFDVEPETPELQELLNSTIQVAFQENVHPRKGMELILKHYGMCRAITMFGAYPRDEGRHESLGLLLRALHAEVVENLKRSILAVEGGAPEGDAIPPLIRGRDWLFDHNAQHTDSSHLVGILRLAGDLDDIATLRIAIELADYGTHLGEMFQYLDDPPFERVYEDRGIHLRALAGEDVERAVRHFDAKAATSDPQRDGPAPAEVLVRLLCRLGRYDDAITASRRYLSDMAPEDLSCPSLAQLCEMAGDFEQLKQVARDRSDTLSYVAAMIKTASRSPQGSKKNEAGSDVQTRLG